MTTATTPFGNREPARGSNGIVKIGAAAALALHAPRRFVNVRAAWQKNPAHPKFPPKP